MEDLNLSVIPYDQEEIEIVLKQLMYKRGITDVMYEGSNISQISSVISYIISTLNVNTAINLQETLLPLASKRMNVLFSARQLGYEPHQKKSYMYDLLSQVQLDSTKPIDDETVHTNIELVHNTKFMSGEKTYWYTGPSITNFFTGVTNKQITDEADPNYTGERITSKYITVKEGELFTKFQDSTLEIIAGTYEDDGDILTNQDYIIPYNNVENNGVQAYLEYIDENGNHVQNELRTKSDSYLIDETLTEQQNKFVQLDNIILGYPTVFFEYVGFGNRIKQGTKINFEVLQSNGINGIATSAFKVSNTVLSNLITISNYVLVSKGTEEETKESIKENALVFHNTANRAVTRYDYITITKRCPLVQESDAWGGEEESPKALGNVWVSCTPSDPKKIINYMPIVNNEIYSIEIGETTKEAPSTLPDDTVNWLNWYLTDDNYETINQHLDNYKVITIQVNKRQPLYIDFKYKIDVIKYDVTKSKSAVNQELFAIIYNYFNDSLEKFDVEYINSNLQRQLDKKLTSSSGLDFKVSAQGVLCYDMIDSYIKDNTGEEVILCNLGLPFESITDNNGDLVVSKVPNIDTSFFGCSTTPKNLIVDYSNLTETINGSGIYSTNIYYSDSGVFNASDIVGTYIVYLNKNKIELKFKFGTFMDEIFNLSASTSGEYARFDILYPSNYNSEGLNLPFIKNTIPRLSEVEFVNN